MADLGEGAIFAGHRIEGVAGRGGMGTVYRATHLVLDHLVALKVISPDLADDESFRERFKSESRIAVSLRHPNVVPIHHAGDEHGLLFVTMDLIDGPDLRKLLAASQGLEPERAIGILSQVASALDVAHSRGLVHRDIKPGNVLIEQRPGGEHAYLTDFGLTKRIDQGASQHTALTSTGAFVGTLDYVAPEQIRGEDLDARCDLYALGCMLHEMLEGRAPFADREENVAKMYAHLQDDPAPLAGSGPEYGRLREVIARAMAKDPDGRYPSAGDLARAAEAALAGESVVAEERSVATGPAAPTTEWGAVGGAGTAEALEPVDPTLESEVPVEPTVESEVPPHAVEDGLEPTVEAEILGDEGKTVEAPPPDADDPPGEDETELFETGAETAAVPVESSEPRGSRGERPGSGLGGAKLAGLFLLIAAVVAGGLVLASGGGDEDPGLTSTTTDVGEGNDGGNQGPEFRAVAEDEISVPGFPVGVDFDDESRAVFAVTRQDGQINRIVRGEGETQGSLPIGARLEDVVVVGGKIFASMPRSGTVAVAPVGSDTFGTAPAGGEPAGLATDGEFIWVANGEGSPGITRISVESVQHETFALPEAQTPYGVAIGSEALWVTDRRANQVLRVPLDGNTPGTPEPIDVGENPKGVAVDSGVVWVANADDGTVTRLDETGAELGTVDLGGTPRDVLVAFDRVWVSNGGEKGAGGPGRVDVLSPDDGERLGSVDDVGLAEELTAGAGRVWVTTGADDSVVPIKPKAGE